MGIFSESDSERAVREHTEGQRDGSKASNLDKVVHNFSGGQSEAYNAGWRNGVDNAVSESGSQEEESPSPYSSETSSRSTSRREPRSNSSSGSNGTSTSSPPTTLGCIAMLVVGGLAIWGLNWISKSGLERYYELKNMQSQQEVWTMREVSATELNVRSGPGTDSPVVGKFRRGARLATTGEPVKVDNQSWIRVSTDDRKTQGWANQKFINFGPYPSEPQTETQAIQETTTDPVAAKPEPTPASTPGPLLVPVPYGQPQRQDAPSQRRSPDDRPISPPSGVRRVTTSPNIKLVETETQESVPNNQQPEQSSDGIPRLKKRPPQ